MNVELADLESITAWDVRGKLAHLGLDRHIVDREIIHVYDDGRCMYFDRRGDFTIIGKLNADQLSAVARVSLGQ